MYIYICTTTIRSQPTVFQTAFYDKKLRMTMIPQVVLNKCETWTLILNDEVKFGIFENKVLRTICGRIQEKETKRRTYIPDEI